MSRGTRDTAKVLLVFAYGAITLYGQTFQPVLLTIGNPTSRSHNPGRQACRFGLFPFRSPLLWESLLLSFPQGTKMFQFPWFASAAYVFSYRCHTITRGGFPHSEIPGSKPVCGSPRLIAAYYVLHRLPMPRHPPSALSSLTIKLRSIP